MSSGGFDKVEEVLEIVGDSWREGNDEWCLEFVESIKILGSTTDFSGMIRLLLSSGKEI